MRRTLAAVAVVLSLAACSSGSKGFTEKDACPKANDLKVDLARSDSGPSDYATYGVGLTSLARQVPGTPLAAALRRLATTAADYAATGKDTAAIDYSLAANLGTIADRCKVLGYEP